MKKIKNNLPTPCKRAFLKSELVDRLELILHKRLSTKISDDIDLALDLVSKKKSLEI